METLFHKEQRTRWSYNLMRTYLLLVAQKGEQALESMHSFPHRIELSNDWHELLNLMRTQSEDGRERWAMVGLKEEKTELFLPTVPVVGDVQSISPLVRIIEMRRASAAHGIIDLVGDIHSHSRKSPDWDEQLMQKLYELNPRKLRAHFSAGDYYTLLHGGGKKAFMGLVEGNYNLFAFKTRQTHSTGDPFHFTQPAFKNYWNEEFKRGPPTRDSIGMNSAIVKLHNVVLYQGYVGKELVRVHPA